MTEQAPPEVQTPRYDFQAAEPLWQQAWDRRGCFAVDDVPTDGRPKYYVLEMFPYPSGKIHMGHVRNYTLGDVVARYRRARGYNVLHPMGWDAFGLPAENAARERRIHPATWTWDNIRAMRAELKRMGLSIDWSREFATCQPEYYGQQQRLFLDFLAAGLVERKESWVNWDPVDGTVLANEQVIDGRGWRSGALIEKKKLSQWFFAITRFAPELLAALDAMDRWPERVRLMQANWIGRSEGARIRFPLTAPQGAIDGVEVYTTRPDTLFGMSFLALAPEHPLALAVGERSPEAAEFIAECRRLGTTAAAIETTEKRGFPTGLSVQHPFIPDRTVPVWIANFVLMDYGTGAIFGCPAHDQRDWDFATGYEPAHPARGASQPRAICRRTRPMTGPGTLMNSELPRRAGGGIRQARRHRPAGRAGLGPWRDQLAPARLGREPPALLGLPDPHHPLCRLRRRAGTGRSASRRLAGGRDLRPAGQPAGPPPDLEARALPVVRRWRHAGDRHLRHLRRQLLVFRPLLRAPPASEPVSREAADHWLPVDQYIGGIEHAILHLLYARFFTRAMRDDRPDRRRRALRRPVHPGHGDA